MYALLTAQIAAAAFIVKKSRGSDSARKLCKPAAFFANFVLGLVALISMYAFREVLGTGGQVALLCVLTVLMALQLQCLTGKFSEERITHALVTVAQIFLSMTVTALVLAMLGVDVSFLGIALFFGFILLLLWGIVLMIWPGSRKLWTTYLFVGCILFSLSILSNTHDFLTNTEDPPTVPEAAMGLYIDLVGLFQKVLILDGDN